jgi:excisionase family DNA binding protein
MAESTQFLLPFAEREYIDVPRCCKILGVNETIVRRLAESGLIDLIDHMPRTRKKVRYQSVVDFCNRLRHQYCIPDTRPRLSAPYLRHRDADLLPFPLSDTISSAEAIDLLGCSLFTMTRLIDEGRIMGYRLLPGRRTPWRISRSSVAGHMQRVLRGVAGGPHAYLQVAVE